MFAAVVIPLVAILVLVLILFLVSKESGRANQSQGRLSRFKEWVPLNSAKIVIVSWQIMASVSPIALEYASRPSTTAVVMWRMIARLTFSGFSLVRWANFCGQFLIDLGENLTDMI